MKALLLKEPRCFEFVEAEMPDAGDKAVVKIKAIGVCGTEISSYNGTFPMGAYPRVLGHEGTGEIPFDLKWEHAVFADPLTNALQGIYRAKVKAGEMVVITGAGPIGVLAAQYVNSIGATAILISAMEKRMTIAKHLGIRHIVNHKTSDPVKAVREITGGRMAEVVIECSGMPDAIRKTLDYASYAGRIALIGYGRSEVPLPTHIITRKELDVLGSRNCLGLQPVAIDAINTGRVKVELIISNLVRFDELPDFYERISNNPDDFMKGSPYFKRF